MNDENRTARHIPIDWNGFASVSESAPQRFQDVADADPYIGDPSALTELRGGVAPSVTEDGSLSAVARWFGVPESEVLDVIAEAEEKEPAGSRVAQPTVPLAEDRGPSGAPPAANQTGSWRSAAYQPRAARSVPNAGFSTQGTGNGRRATSPSPMAFRELMGTLRRRLLAIVGVVLLGVAAGWATAPGPTRRAVTFQATHTMFYEPAAGQGYNIQQVALLATSGEVPGRVAARLKLNREQVRGAVTAVVDSQVGTLSITGRAPTPDVAVSLAEMTAEELAAVIDGGVQAAYHAELDRLNGQLTTARNRLNNAKTPVDQAAARGDADAAQRALEQLQEKGAPKAQLQTLEKAAASAVGAPGVHAPNSKPVRAALLGAMGLLVSLVGAVALDRLDNRVRSKAGAEEAFGVPVVAEVPGISKAAQGQFLAFTQASSPFVEAYRGLRTYIALWAPETGEDDGHRVIVVTSPSPSEGKTTTVAHLAAMLAEIGRSVVVVSADLRKPRIHQYFDRAAAPGLVDVLAAAPGAPAFDDLDLVTPVRGVRLVPSGPPVENPAPLLENAGDLLRAARGLADFVLVDSPPLLVANDAVDLARHADGVLLVARAGQTPIDAAEHCAELLGRLEIPVVGTVLVGSESASRASRYYASRYYAEPEQRGGIRRPASGNRQEPSAPQEAPPSAGHP